MLTNNRIDSISSLYVQNVQYISQKTVKQEVKNPNDKLVLSAQGREFAVYLNKLKNMPSVRMDVVKKYQNLIANGQYKVDSEKLATDILDRSIMY